MSSSRLARDNHGRTVVIVTTLDVVSVGETFYVLGNEVGAGPDGGWNFTGSPTGRFNTVTEPRTSNRDPLPAER